MNVYTIISMTYIQLIQPLSKQSAVAELVLTFTQDFTPFSTPYTDPISSNSPPLNILIFYLYITSRFLDHVTILV